MPYLNGEYISSVSDLPATSTAGDLFGFMGPGTALGGLLSGAGFLNVALTLGKLLGIDDAIPDYTPEELARQQAADWAAKANPILQDPAVASSVLFGDYGGAEGAGVGMESVLDPGYAESAIGQFADLGESFLGTEWGDLIDPETLGAISGLTGPFAGDKNTYMSGDNIVSVNNDGSYDVLGQDGSVIRSGTVGDGLKPGKTGAFDISAYSPNHSISTTGKLPDETGGEDDLAEQWFPDSANIIAAYPWWSSGGNTGQGDNVVSNETENKDDKDFFDLLLGGLGALFGGGSGGGAGGTGIGGSVINYLGQREGYEEMADAAKYATDEQKALLEQLRTDLEPFRNMVGKNDLRKLLGRAKRSPQASDLETDVLLADKGDFDTDFGTGISDQALQEAIFSGLGNLQGVDPRLGKNLGDMPRFWNYKGLEKVDPNLKGLTRIEKFGGLEGLQDVDLNLGELPEIQQFGGLGDLTEVDATLNPQANRQRIWGYDNLQDVGVDDSRSGYQLDTRGRANLLRDARQTSTGPDLGGLPELVTETGEIPGLIREGTDEYNAIQDEVLRQANNVMNARGKRQSGEMIADVIPEALLRARGQIENINSNLVNQELAKRASNAQISGGARGQLAGEQFGLADFGLAQDQQEYGQVADAMTRAFGLDEATKDRLFGQSSQLRGQQTGEQLALADMIFGQGTSKMDQDARIQAQRFAQSLGLRGQEVDELFGAADRQYGQSLGARQQMANEQLANIANALGLRGQQVAEQFGEGEMLFGQDLSQRQQQANEQLAEIANALGLRQQQVTEQGTAADRRFNQGAMRRGILADENAQRFAQALGLRQQQADEALAAAGLEFDQLSEARNQMFREQLGEFEADRGLADLLYGQTSNERMRELQEALALDDQEFNQLMQVVGSSQNAAAQMGSQNAAFGGSLADILGIMGAAGGQQKKANYDLFGDILGGIFNSGD